MKIKSLFVEDDSKVELEIDVENSTLVIPARTSESKINLTELVLLVEMIEKMKPKETKKTPLDKK